MLIDFAQAHAVTGQDQLEVLLRIGRSDVQRVFVARRLGRKAHQELQVGEEERDRFGLQRGALVERLLDVPSMKDVLAQSQSYRAVEVEDHRSEVQLVMVALLGRQFLQSSQQCLVGGEGVGDLSVRRLRVRHVPDGLIELRRRLAITQRVVDAVFEDDRRRTDVTHHVSDGPLGGVGRGDVVTLTEAIDNRLKASDGQFQYIKACRHETLLSCWGSRKAYCSSTTVRSRSRTSFTPVSPSVTIISD